MSHREKSQEAEYSNTRRARSRSRSGSRSHKERTRTDLRKSSRRHKRKRSRSSSIHGDSDRHHKYYKGKRGHRERRQEDRDQKIDEIFDWMKSSRETRSRRSYSNKSSSGSVDTRRKSYSKSRHSHDLSFDSRSVRSVVVPVTQTQNQVSERGENLDQGEVDILTARLNALRAEGLPKPITGPAISEELSPVLNLFLAKSEFAKTMKVCEKYPRPSNIENLAIPELPKDANKIIDQKSVKNDERMMNDQKCTSAMFAALGKSLDVVVTLKDKCPELVQVGDMLLDTLQMTGFLHQDITNLRLKGFKQTVNPSYGDVVSQKPEEPGMLLGKTPLGEQMKTCDEINKLKAKFKKPEPHAQAGPRKDFRKGGEFKKKPFRPNNRKRDDRKTRYFSPKGSYRKNQQEAVQKQEDRQNVNYRKH